MHLIADVLEQHLPQSYPAAADAILSALPPPLNPDLRDDDFGHFIYLPLGFYIQNHGLEGHISTSLDALEELTQRFSMEFPIRAFLNRWPEETLDRMQGWAGHSNYHVRRLVSEGTRPRLPWGQSIKLEDKARWPLLDRLHADPTRFVTRSVANHLNDLTRSAPEDVLARFRAWEAADQQSTKELEWMRRHALRTLIKAGDPAAMDALGYRRDMVRAASICFDRQDIKIGASARIEAQITLSQDAPVLIDYVIDFIKANGSTSPKVFKLSVVEGKADVAIEVGKKHVFKKGATTFTLHPGPHTVHLQVNGQRVASSDFTLS